MALTLFRIRHRDSGATGSESPTYPLVDRNVRPVWRSVARRNNPERCCLPPVPHWSMLGGGVRAWPHHIKCNIDFPGQGGTADGRRPPPAWGQRCPPPPWDQRRHGHGARRKSDLRGATGASPFQIIPPGHGLHIAANRWSRPGMCPASWPSGPHAVALVCGALPAAPCHAHGQPVSVSPCDLRLSARSRAVCVCVPLPSVSVKRQ